jgi:hypothetical protein
VPVRHRVVAAFALGSVAVSAVVAVATWNLTTGYMLQQREQSVSRQALVNAGWWTPGWPAARRTSARC